MQYRSKVLSKTIFKWLSKELWIDNRNPKTYLILRLSLVSRVALRFYMKIDLLNPSDVSSATFIGSKNSHDTDSALAVSKSESGSVPKAISAVFLGCVMRR